jgi:hypothetical protein
MEAGAIAVEGGPNGTVAARAWATPETNVVNSFGFAHEVLTSACSAPR